MKNNRSGQATTFTALEYLNIRKQYSSYKHKLLLDIGWYTGERWGAIIQLLVADVYTSQGKAKDYITFRAATRKATPDGKRTTRQVPVNSNLKDILNQYPVSPNSLWLFPGRNEANHIHFRTCEYIFKKAVANAGLGNKGISTHSTRRSLITYLNEKGIGIKTIQKITGHQDIRSLIRYIDISEDKIKGALEQI